MRLLHHILRRLVLTGKSKIHPVEKAADEADRRLAETVIDERIDLGAKTQDLNGKKSAATMVMMADETAIQAYNGVTETITALGPDPDPDHRPLDGHRLEGKIEIVTEIATTKSV